MRRSVPFSLGEFLVEGPLLGRSETDDDAQDGKDSYRRAMKSASECTPSQFFLKGSNAVSNLRQYQADDDDRQS
jgi:hypothetical protein